jgi:nucleotide-binding universal stress UspA family protein
MAGIIVGVDGSDHSRRALGWAMREAVKQAPGAGYCPVRRSSSADVSGGYWDPAR